MILVNIEGNLIENIVIYKGDLLFSYNSDNNEAVYTPVPFNEYIFGTDRFDTVQLFLYHEYYLGFCFTKNINKFKNYCLEKFEEGILNFKYNGLSVNLERIYDFPLDIKEI